jgi:glucokinase
MTQDAAPKDNVSEPTRIVVNIDGPVVEFAQIALQRPTELLHVKKYRASDFMTATDCIRCYADTLPGRSLVGHPAAIAVSAAITGDSVRISRGGWIISISGLRHMFGAQPLVLNDSVALAWAGADFSARNRKPVGRSDFSEQPGEGRVVVINWGFGLGAAAIQEMPDGTRFAIPCEVGHTGFSPETELELILHRLMGKGRYPVTWEQILCLSPTDAIWRDPALNLDIPKIEAAQAELAGAFASNVVLSVTAWNGVVFIGSRASILEKESNALLFNQRFEQKAAYRNKIRSTPRWTLNDPLAALKGCARLLDEIF